MLYARGSKDCVANAQAFAYNVDNSDGAYQSTTTWRNSWLVPELSAKTLDALKESNPAKRAALYQSLQQLVSLSGAGDIPLPRIH